MILYNMRERGPYEYDKFVLNILQMYNAINLSEIEELTEGNKEQETLLSLNNSLDVLFNSLVGEDGISNKICNEFKKYKEE